MKYLLEYRRFLQEAEEKRTGENSKAAEIQKHRNSGISRILFRRLESSDGTTCDRCGAPIRNVTTVTFKDETTTDLGPECIHKFLEHEDNSIMRVLRDLDASIAINLEIAKNLELPAEKMLVKTAQNAEPGDLLQTFIAYIGRNKRPEWLTTRHGMLRPPWDFDEYLRALHGDEKKAREMWEKDRKNLEAEKAQNKIDTATLQTRRAKLIATSWKRT